MHGCCGLLNGGRDPDGLFVCVTRDRTHPAPQYEDSLSSSEDEAEEQEQQQTQQLEQEGEEKEEEPAATRTVLPAPEPRGKWVDSLVDDGQGVSDGAWIAWVMESEGHRRLILSSLLQQRTHMHTPRTGKGDAYLARVRKRPKGEDEDEEEEVVCMCI